MNFITLFEFTPFELLESILPYLNKDELLSFLAFYDIKGRMNWNVIYSLRFDKIKNNINYDNYMHWLSLEKLKSELTLKCELEQLDNSKQLNLSATNLNVLPKEIGNLTNLEEINLNGNNLVFLPEEISNLKNLQRLYLSYNKLISLPEGIVGLVNLQLLYLSGNKLTNIPEGIGQLINLNALTLENNNLTYIPEGIKQLINLQTLYLANNNLSDLEQQKIKNCLPQSYINF